MTMLHPYCDSQLSKPSTRSLGSLREQKASVNTDGESPDCEFRPGFGNGRLVGRSFVNSVSQFSDVDAQRFVVSALHLTIQGHDKDSRRK